MSKDIIIISPIYFNLDWVEDGDPLSPQHGKD